VPAGHSRNPHVRRVDHAHRLQPDIRPAQRGIRPAGASALAIVAIALVALLLRPWDGLGAAADDRASAAPHASGLAHPVAAATTTAMIGPRGELVDAGEDSALDIPRGSHLPAADAAKPLRPALLAGYQWPTRNARLTNAFGAGRPSSFRLDGVVFHDGIDIASFCGAWITAAHDGVVLGAGRRNEGLLGWVGDLAPFRAKVEAEDAWGRQAITVVIDDGNGYRSIYAHLGLAVVKRGETVAAGDLLGYQGASGNATGCHLHYALFDPRDEGRLTLEPKTARKTRLPAQEIARIDPLLVLPPLEAGGITWGWGAR
jgi:murein DD-endopeptidase MepM/ murein hydrolase activator NlpD